MSRGKPSQVGDVRVSPNGYQYTRTAHRGWRTTHTLLMEEHLGRELFPNERVRFKDQNKRNIVLGNLEVYIVKEGSRARKIAQIRSKIEDLQGQLERLLEEDS